MKRIALLITTNIAIMVVLSIVGPCWASTAT